MSRCFPYPPPGYVSNRATGDSSSLIDSIKIKSDTEKIKKEKKEQKRRDKEERKKVKKEKKREKEISKSIHNIEGANKRKRDGDGLDQSLDKSWINSKEVDIQKKNETEAEQLERSCLSEEHGQPVLTESLSYSSDGTQSKSKRIRIEQSPSRGNCTTQGKAVRFRLKRREHESAHPTEDIPSPSGRTSTPAVSMFDATPAKEEPCLVKPVPLADNDIKDPLQVPVEQLSLGRPQAAHASNDIDILPLCNSSVSKSRKKPKSAYEALFSNWVPPQFHFEAVTGNDDEQWMLPCKKQAQHNRLSLESVNGVSGMSCSSAWPRAYLVPEADLFVLPFTVPL